MAIGAASAILPKGHAIPTVHKISPVDAFTERSLEPVTDRTDAPTIVGVCGLVSGNVWFQRKSPSAEDGK
jgi:hypothetical protein